MASNAALYGIIGALSVTVVGGGLYIAKQEGAFGSPDKAAAVTAPTPAPLPASAPAPAPPAPKSPVIAAPPPALAPPPPASGTSQAEAMLARQLVVDAQRDINRGDFDAAARAIDQAERLAPTSSDVIAAARRDLRDARQRANREDHHRVDELVQQARAAMGHHDYAGADRLLDQAEKIDPRDDGVKQARAELATARQHANRDDRRVDELVKQARAAITYKDYAAADRLLDQAETIDRRDRDVQQARAELNAAQRPAPPPGSGRR